MILDAELPNKKIKKGLINLFFKVKKKTIFLRIEFFYLSKKK